MNERKKQLEKMDAAMQELKDNKCLHSAWNKVKSAVERKIKQEEKEGEQKRQTE